MMEQDPNDRMPDRMTPAIAICGYAIGAAIIFVMFYWAMPASSLF